MSRWRFWVAGSAISRVEDPMLHWRGLKLAFFNFNNHFCLHFLSFLIISKFLVKILRARVVESVRRMISFFIFFTDNVVTTFKYYNALEGPFTFRTSSDR